MVSTTADQTPAFPGEFPRVDASLLSHLVRLAAPAGRRTAAAGLAFTLGADDLLIFLRDPAGTGLRAAPGLAGPVPPTAEWVTFLSRAAVGECRATLPVPGRAERSPVLGLADAEGSVLVLLGGRPRRGDTRALLLLLPLLTAVFRGEEAAMAARSQAEVARAAVAEARELHAALEAARQELQDALSVRDQFLAIAAHELRTPLTALLGQATLLERRAGREAILSPRDRRAVDVIAGRARKLDHLIDGLLDVTRLQAGLLPLELRPLDLGEFLRGLITNLRPSLEHDALTLECPATRLPVLADRPRLAQVFRNLLDNAVRYSPVAAPLAVRVTPAGDQVAVAVVDQGIGVPAEAQALIFERYYRAANALRQNLAGVGLGLYLVREIVIRHGGTVAVSSAEGAGSTFTVILPLAAAPV